jgi:hypothetical protein
MSQKDGNNDTLRKRVRRASGSAYEHFIDAVHEAEHKVEDVVHRVEDALTVAWDQLGTLSPDSFSPNS